MKTALLVSLLFTGYPIFADCSLAAPSKFESPNPISLALSPNGNCLAVANISTGNISVYSVNKKKCSLKPVSLGEIEFGLPISLAFSPNGDCVASFNAFSNTITVFSFDQAKCKIGKAPKQIVFAGGPAIPTISLQPNIIAFSPKGTCLVVANLLANELEVYGFNPKKCSITNKGIPVDVISMQSPSALAFSPNGELLAVTNVQPNESARVTLFTQNSRNCKLKVLSRASIAVSPSPLGVAFAPNNNYLAVTDLLTNKLSFLKIDKQKLSVLKTFHSYTSYPLGVTYSPDGDCLVVSNLLSVPSYLSVLTINKRTGLPTSLKKVRTRGSSPIVALYSKNGCCLLEANISSENVNTFIVKDCKK